jgi:hypothetical protein
MRRVIGERGREGKRGAARRGWLARVERGPRAARPGPAFTAADLALVAALFVATRTAILALAALAAAQGAAPDAAAALSRWDAHWYLKIAAEGYMARAGLWDGGDGSTWPFFPALPLLIAGFGRLTGLEGAAAGLAVAHLLHLGGMLAFFAYARGLFGRRFARVAVAFFALWPFTVHQSVPMSEAVFVPLSLLALQRARAGDWAGAGVAAAGLSATRVAGAFVAFPLLALAARRFGLLRVLTVAPGTEGAVAMLAACGLGGGAFALHLWLVTGDALAFSHAQVAWGREPKWPWMTVLDALNPWLRDGESILWGAFNLGVAAAALALAVCLVRLRMAAEAGFAAIVIMLGLLAGETMSLPRFAGAVTPLAIPLAWVAFRNPVWRAPMAAASGVAMAWAAWAWCTGSLWMM